MDKKKFREQLNQMLDQKGLTLDSTLKELSENYNIDAELNNDLEARINHSSDSLLAHKLFFEDLESSLSGYDQKYSFIELSNGEMVPISADFRRNINAGITPQIKYYLDILLDKDEIQDDLKLNYLESILEKIARFYSITMFLPKLSDKMKGLNESNLTDIRKDPSDFPLKTPGLTIMFMKELGMLDLLLKKKPREMTRLLIILLPVYTGQEKTIERILSAIRSNNIKDKNHPYFVRENKDVLDAIIKRFFT